MKRTQLIVLVLSVVAIAGFVTAAQPISTAARKLYETHQDSVVFVSAVAKMEISARGKTANRELKREAIGTIIDASGLTVLSYSNLDPSGALSSQFSVKAEFADVKIRLADGTEVPAKIVLKDTDLDLAFVMPDADSDEAEDVEFKPLDLGNNVQPKILDEVISLGRLGNNLSRQPVVFIGRIAAIVKKPRDFYLTTRAAMGGPLFSSDGKLIGIAVRRITNGRPSGTIVVLPAGDIQEVAAQALDKTKPEPATQPATQPASLPAPKDKADAQVDDKTPADKVAPMDE